MKKFFLVSFLLMFIASPCWALFIHNGSDFVNVGSYDSLFAETNTLDNSSEEEELNWINSVVPETYTEYYKFDGTPTLYAVYDEDQNSIITDAYAFYLGSAPDYFLIKWGDKNDTNYLEHSLWTNNESDYWAIFNISNLDPDLEVEILNIDALSHYGTVGAAPVPEPATMLLLGTGLVGLAATGRKKFKK